MNTSDDGMVVRIIENTVRSWDWMFGHAENDYWRLWLSNYMLFQTYSKKGGLQTLLFDIENDVRETKNIADKHPDIVHELLLEVEEYKKHKPKSSPYWMVTKDWEETFVPGMYKYLYKMSIYVENIKYSSGFIRVTNIVSN